MKTLKLLSWVLCALLLGQPARAAQTAASPQPSTLNPQPALGPSGAAAVITSTRTLGNTVWVTATIPAGNNQVTLQTRGSGGGAWVPRSVQRVSAKARSVTFSIAKSKTPETFRVWVQKQPLPSAFYNGRQAFTPLHGTSANLATLVNSPANLAALNASSSTSATSTTSTTVTTSDIWQINGNRLYFFNQYRGLQVLDITLPDAPVLLGQLDLPAAGEQLYVLDSNHVVLLAQDCSSDDGQTDVDVVNVATGVPVISASLPVSGWLEDSRLVGSALYVTCDAWVGSGDNATWGTQISAFDCSNPEAPAARPTLWLPGYESAVTASANYLFVAVDDATNWWQSDLNCIDISTGDGTMNDTAVIQTAGQISDPSQINLAGSVLATVSQAWDQTDYWDTTITLETFSLADPAAPVALGSLQVDPGQSLSAACFDTNLVLISTSDASAPLFVVDVSNPAAPQLAGQINLPGSQNYLYPLGSQLLTIGQGNWTNWQTMVSLFDLSNPANPTLLSQVGVGGPDSWSEADYDPEAFTILPGAGLILVPFQSWSANTNASGVQLIDLGASALTARGVICQAQARRATLFQNRVLSLSGEDYLSGDVSDQDNPSLTGSLTLAWPVDTVIVAGQYLLEIGGADFDQPATVVRVTKTAAPGVLAAQWALTNGPILGAGLQSNLLYVLEGNGPDSSVIVDPILGPVVAQPLARTLTRAARPRAITSATDTTMTLNVIDTTQLPNLVILGQTTFNTGSLPSGNLQALWPQPGTLAWVGARQQNWFWPLLGASPTSGALMVYPGSWFWNSSGIQLWTFNVSRPDAPVLDSSFTVATNGWSDGGVATATNGLVYLSHSVWNFGALPGLPIPVLQTLDTHFPVVSSRAPVSDPAPLTGAPGTAPARLKSAQKPNTAISTPALFPAEFTWSQGDYLDVVDLTVPTLPALRPAVNIPGPLAGVSREGNVIYTSSSSWQTGQTLEALAYDGVTAYQVASLPLGTDWDVSPLIFDETIFAAQNNSGENATNWLTAWTLTDQATFQRLGGTTLAAPISALAAFKTLLGVQAGNGISLFNAAQPAALQTLGSGSPAGCLWPSLTGADGNVSAGLWSPLGDYGVFFIGVGP